MKFKFFQLILCMFLTFMLKGVYAQSSSNTVTYKLTYDPATGVYTAWVIPNYNTPNANNTSTQESGPTAQTTIALPCSVSITSLTDVNGVWQKPGSQGFLKLGPTLQPAIFGGQGLDPNTCYYVIGKSTDPTNYGQFVNGTPIQLYTFKTDGCAGPIRIIDPNEPFIAVANSQASLNTANSFYSISGQPAGGNQVPLEQYITTIGGPALCTVNTPVPVTESATTPQYIPVTMNVLTNDKTSTGAQATPANSTISIATTPTCGSATPNNTTGTVVYSPGSCAPGTYPFTYQLCDIGTTNCATVVDYVTVTAPTIVANTDSPSSNPLQAPANTLTTQSVLPNDTYNGSTATPTTVYTSIFSQPSCGSVSMNSSTGVATYTPGTNCSGLTSYTYQICALPNYTPCSTATNYVNVASPAIIANPDNSSTTTSTPVNTPVLSNDTFNGTTPTINTVDVVINSIPSHGTAVVQPDGTITYTPTAGYTGPDSYTYKICSKGSTTNCATTTVNLTVTCGANGPNAVADNITVSNGTATTSVLNNDTNAGSVATMSNVTLTVTTPPANGYTSTDASGNIIYTQTNMAATSDSYTYKICDKTNTSCCSTATNNITMSPVTVVAVTDIISTPVGTPVTTVVLTNDTRNGVPTNNSQVNVSMVTNPTKGTTTVNADGTITYSPNAGYPAGTTDSYTYKICDKVQTAVCSTAVNTVTLGSGVSDLEIIKTVNNSSASVNSPLTYTLTVKNNGPNATTAVNVSDVLPSTLTYNSSTPSTGTYSSGTGVWNIPSLANGATATLNIQATVNAGGTANNTATILSQSNTDPVSSNNTSSVCTSVPITMPTGSSMQLSVPSTYTNVVWYNNGTQVGTGTSFTATQSGSYTFTASNGTCPANGCCPTVIQTVVSCSNICPIVSATRLN